jgi:hypothetical protein
LSGGRLAVESVSQHGSTAYGWRLRLPAAGGSRNGGAWQRAQTDSHQSKEYCNSATAVFFMPAAD